MYSQNVVHKYVNTFYPKLFAYLFSANLSFFNDHLIFIQFFCIAVHLITLTIHYKTTYNP